MISGGLANTATAIFVGTEAFIGGIIIDPFEHWAAAVFFFFFFAACMFNFTWFREQTCTILCPYGRLQSVLLDQESLTVAYDHRRGEPRGKRKKSDDQQQLGDCVDCYRCVEVCPTGIDIRNGNQMECLHCAACIDACNDVMAKTGAAPNLITYLSEAELANAPHRWLRPRTVIYSCVLVALLIGTSFAIFTRPLIQAVPVGTVGAPALADSATLRQGFRISLINKTKDTASVSLTPQIGQLISQFPTIHIPPNERIQQVMYLSVPLIDMPNASQKVRIDVKNSDNRTITSLNQTIRKPFGSQP